MTLIWHYSYDGSSEITDCEVGRFRVKRTAPNAHTFDLRLNGEDRGRYGSMDAAKNMAEYMRVHTNVFSFFSRVVAAA